MAGHWLQHLLAPGPSTAPSTDGGRVRFLGTSGFELVAAGGEVVVLDPYLSRPGLLRSLCGRLDPDAALLRREIPRADAVLCGHSHHDHALDAPIVCRNTGALLVGSESTLNLGRAAGLPETQLRRADGPLRLGGVVATPIPSRHGKAILGRVPLPGDIDAPPRWPPRLWDLRHGPVMLWHLDLGDLRVLHVDSADWRDEALDGVEADVLCLCAVGRQYRRDYTRGLVARVRPRWVIPCHWDDFTLPWGHPPRQLPGVRVEDFVDEIRAAGAEPVVMGLGARWSPA
jgi:L-ascorbate metabolism protein UlaG (beta-lactamase superfamily)